MACAKTLQFQLTSPRGNERSLRTAYGQGIRPFQFTSPQGDEQEVKPSVDFGWIFQLTSPQGDEHLILLSVLSASNFNSRLRKETNSGDEDLKALEDISTHVSVRRRTMQIMQNAEHFVISTHVSARRRTVVNVRNHPKLRISIHVSARRRTLHSHCYLRLLRFQLTSP